MNYNDFINSKSKMSESHGFDIDTGMLNKHLFDFQRDIVKWALAKGKAAIFADCGLGKTLMQLSWAYEIYLHTGGSVLILAPLAVAAQTQSEGERFDIPVTICESDDDIVPGVNITNYEKLGRFNTDNLIGVVLDESSILKSFTGKVRTDLINRFSNTPYRLACTATPAPNDYMELGNHAEFLGIMSRNEMLSMYFAHDGSDTAKWRLKGHAENTFWEWMASWAVVLDNPASLGYDDDGYELPELHVHEIVVDKTGEDVPTLSLLERHICPLQLDTVARCIELWSNPNDIVLDPFAGIGTVPVMALRMGRRALGFELKESYYNQSIINIQEDLNND